jgi:hypothetical protein
VPKRPPACLPAQGWCGACVPSSFAPNRPRKAAVNKCLTISLFVAPLRPRSLFCSWCARSRAFRAISLRFVVLVQAAAVPAVGCITMDFAMQNVLLQVGSVRRAIVRTGRWCLHSAFRLPPKSADTSPRFVTTTTTTTICFLYHHHHHHHTMLAPSPFLPQHGCLNPAARVPSSAHRSRGV